MPRAGLDPEPDPMQPPAVSVLMPVYNAERYVGPAVESILAQSFADWEFVIVDDGSTDRSLEILRGYAAREPRIRLTSRPNVGIVASRNELLGAARSDLIAWLDNDDVALPGRLEAQVAYLRDHPDCVLVGGQAMIIDPDGHPLTIMGHHFEHEDIIRGLLNAEGQLLYTSAVMLRKGAALRAGGYRQETETAEDLDLYLRMAEVGRLANLRRPLAQYRERMDKAGYKQRQQQTLAVRRSLRGAYDRRGLAIPPWLDDFELGSPGGEELRQTWAWWALGSGFVATARKHARAAMVRRPLSPASWRLLYCTLRGR